MSDIDVEFIVICKGSPTDALPAIHKRFRGIKPAPAGIDYNFTKWYVPKGEQKYTMSPY